jgi:nitroimidazol reductase NimA-like FMN-containing flavoprotein (pyridoxamine 5'-phosphate oxidase superfamily)
MSTIEITAPIHAPAEFDAERQRELVRKSIAKQSFCTLATTSSALRPHVVGVRYVEIGGVLYMTMFDESVKVRNIRENERVAVCIPVRKYPFVPPYAVQFQGTAELLSRTDPRIVELFEAGRLKGIISKTDYADPHTIFARITPGKRVSTYGIGVSLLQIVREPTSAIRSVEL